MYQESGEIVVGCFLCCWAREIPGGCGGEFCRLHFTLLYRSNRGVRLMACTQPSCVFYNIVAFIVLSPSTSLSLPPALEFSPLILSSPSPSFPPLSLYFYPSSLSLPPSLLYLFLSPSSLSLPPSLLSLFLSPSFLSLPPSLLSLPTSLPPLSLPFSPYLPPSLSLPPIPFPSSSLPTLPPSSLSLPPSLLSLFLSLPTSLPLSLFPPSPSLPPLSLLSLPPLSPSSLPPPST